MGGSLVDGPEERLRPVTTGGTSGVVEDDEGDPTFDMKGGEFSKAGLPHTLTIDETASTCASTPDAGAASDSTSLWTGGVEDFTRQISDTSDFCFADPAQTMIVFDWDDTLFPTTDLMTRKGLSLDKMRQGPDLEPELMSALAQWEEKLYEYLTLACSLSERCVIITNSRRPWVEDCVNVFAPRLKPVFERAVGGPKVVYAKEKLRWTKTMRSQSYDLRPVLHRDHDLNRLTDEERIEELMMAKYEAMKSEAQEFYSQYSGQSWKNIISIGDMNYEHDALQELNIKRSGPSHENLRTKALLLPTEPTLSELTLRLSFSRVMLCAYVHFDGDFDIDLTSVKDPVRAIAEALQLPLLAHLPFSKHAWGLEPSPPGQQEVALDLAELATTVYSEVFA